MSTWHQRLNGAFRELYAPGKSYKVVSNEPNQMASAMTFPTRGKAHAYAEKTGAKVIPPLTSYEVVVYEERSGKVAASVHGLSAEEALISAVLSATSPSSGEAELIDGRANDIRYDGDKLSLDGYFAYR